MAVWLATRRASRAARRAACFRASDALSEELLGCALQEDVAQPSRSGSRGEGCGYCGTYAGGAAAIRCWWVGGYGGSMKGACIYLETLTSFSLFISSEVECCSKRGDYL